MIEPIFYQAKALHQAGRLAEAETLYRRILDVVPDDFDSLNLLGVACGQQGKYEEAIPHIDAALKIHPAFAPVLHNRGLVLENLMRLDEALACYDEAVALGHTGVFRARAHLKLMTGRYREAWPDYERWEMIPPRGWWLDIPARPWQGEELIGRRLLVFADGGMGDVIQFARYLPMLAARHDNVSFLANAKVLRLLRPLTAGLDVVSRPGFRRDRPMLEDEAAYDFQLPLGSLPRRFDTDLATIPAEVPYLAAEEAAVAQWRARIGCHGFKVGIAWQGTPGLTWGGQIPGDQGRSIPLAEFARLAGLPGVRLISLQKNYGLDQLAGMEVETLGEFDSGPDAFIDTAAVMQSLDLVISSDTSIAHLAGALARPTWLALQYVPEWRWMLDRADSPWYPTMRLFRQSRPGDWASVFGAIESELRSRP